MPRIQPRTIKLESLYPVAQLTKTYSKQILSASLRKLGPSFLSTSRSLLLQLFSLSLSCSTNFLLTLGLLSLAYAHALILAILKETIKQRNKKQSLDSMSSSVHLLTYFSLCFYSSCLGNNCLYLFLLLPYFYLPSAHFTQAYIPRTAPKQLSSIPSAMASILPDHYVRSFDFIMFNLSVAFDTVDHTLLLFFLPQHHILCCSSFLA